jgi:hypothetical protein
MLWEGLGGLCPEKSLTADYADSADEGKSPGAIWKRKETLFPGGRVTALIGISGLGLGIGVDPGIAGGRAGDFPVGIWGVSSVAFCKRPAHVQCYL